MNWSPNDTTSQVIMVFNGMAAAKDENVGHSIGFSLPEHVYNHEKSAELRTMTGPWNTNIQDSAKTTEWLWGGSKGRGW